ncbi:sulfite exporter TauE/SafE family protein [Desulfogranum mediterraneum]|uniref:sulfite exporter TauE/SafE family protein n=1 Tax=Desulfogranum mediterraneum TaxID=160661 RepID=UPI000409EA04|nr:sulfite exporter TauE/SafE family protein [Desulfogranum mediterraneum]
MLFYLASFTLTLFFSALFATGGVGSAIVLIPLLSLLGVGFDLAKAAGLLVNTVTTSTASLINYRQKVLEVKAAVPFLCISGLSAPLGAYAGQHFKLVYIKALFVLFLLLSAYLIFGQQEQRYLQREKMNWLMYPLACSVGFMAGLLGIGGGALIIPALAYMRFPPKKIAATVSLMIPASTCTAFLSYAYLVDIDWILIMVITVAALLGGIIGTTIMHSYLRDVEMKNILAAILCLIAGNMIYGMIIR